MDTQTDSYRAPRQKRGQERVNKILEAAETLFAEVGYEAATTNEIAARAATSIGSLYQFFDHKEAILAVLTQRYSDEMEHGMDKVLTAVGDQSLTVIFMHLLDALRDFYHKRPGFQPLFYGSYGSEDVMQASNALYEKLITRVQAILSARLPDLDAVQIRICAEVLISVVKGQLILIEEAGPDHQARVYAEVQRLIRAYLADLTQEHDN